MTMWWGEVGKGHPLGFILARRSGPAWFGRLCSTHNCAHPLDSGYVQSLMDAGQLQLRTLPTPGRTYFLKEN